MSGLGAAAANEGHPVDDLPALVSGTLALSDVRRIVRHLRTCDDCRRRLVEVVGASAAVDLLRAFDEPDVGDLTPDDHVTLPPLTLGNLAPVPTMAPSEAETGGEHDEAPPRRPSRRRAGGLALAAAAVAAIVAVAVAVTGGSGPSTVGVALQPVGTSSGSGRVTMTTSGSDRTMTVDTRLAAPAPGSFYEVWLLNQTTGQMLAVGVLPDDGKARFSVPGDLLAAYDSVDVSLEPDDGVAAHSADSVLRAKYASIS